MKKALRYLSLSDIHLGHKKTSTTEIIRNLDHFFDHYKSTSQFSNLDIVFIVGDLFDDLLDLSGEDIHEITLWLSRLMHFCARFKIALRILEGTPSHDWKQSKIAETVSKVITVPLDFKYIDTLHIERHEELQVDILYIPDEWTSSTELTFHQVQTLMKEMRLESVDLAMMHGMFGYQLRNVPGNIQKHSEANYLSIVKHFINIGHIHSFSTFDRIIAQGSFDRIAHGEEEPKGAVLCTIEPNGEGHFSFIENKGAKLYKTIELRNKDLEKSLNTIERQLGKLRENSYVRIKAAKDHPVYIAFDEVKLKFPMYYFTKMSLEEEEQNNYLLIDPLTDSVPYTPVTITPENIVPLLMAEVQGKYSLDETRLKLLESSLKSLQ